MTADQRWYYGYATVLGVGIMWITDALGFSVSTYAPIYLAASALGLWIEYKIKRVQ